MSAQQAEALYDQEPYELEIALIQNYYRPATFRLKAELYTINEESTPYPKLTCQDAAYIF
jgi:hypothetical protein